MGNLNAWAPRVLSLLRIVAALLFIEHGAMKLFHFPAAPPGPAGPLPTMLLAAGWIEVVGGSLVLVGLFTRAASFILAGEMAAAYFIGHFPHSPWPGINLGGEAILFCWIFFYLVFAGGGPWSLDAALRTSDRQM